jgi:glycine/D-amino acid oxidase-like deaminating enzyme
MAVRRDPSLEPGRLQPALERRLTIPIETHDAHGWWLAQAGPVEPQPSVEGEVQADVVVVGGGFTGMWTATLLRGLAPDIEVVIVEGAICGEGPSGRNGGFVNELWFSLPAMVRRFGDERAHAVARASHEAVTEVGRWCESNGVDAWFRQGGYLEVSTTPLHDGRWDETVAACRRVGEADACRPLGADAVAARCASPIFRAGAYFPGAATVNPALLTRGLRDALINQGVRVFENSAVRTVREADGGVEVRTAGGTVRAPQAVLAAGYGAAGFSGLRHRLTLTSSHMLITEPVPDVLDELGWTGGECITDCRAMINYFRTTPDGRIAFGWGGGHVILGSRIRRRAEVDPALAQQVAAHLVRFFPQLKGRRIEHAWGGPIDVSPTHIPVVGSRAGGRMHYAFGYTGNGVGPSRLAARCLASLALDRRDEFARLAIVEPKPKRVPPEPFRYAGGEVIRAAILRKEEAEERGGRPGAITRAVAAIPEKIGIHVGR